jgi:hypothetical protein
MALPYFVAAAVSGTIRVGENLLSISKDAQRYLNNEISFEQATDSIVKNKRLYTFLTTTKILSDTIVLSITGRWIFDIVKFVRSIFQNLISYGLEAFINGIKLSFEHFFLSLKNCSIPLVLSQFKYLYDKRKNSISSFSIINFCNICNQIYFLIIGKTNGFTKTIQLELTKYWLECMGIIRVVAESNNINFVKYMNQSCSRNNISSLNDNHSFDLKELQWERAKDPDFFRIIKPSLEDIFHGRTYDVIVSREVREIDKKEQKIEEEKYTVTIEPGCPDGKEFRFIEAGHRDPVNIPADLIVKIQTEQHELYERIGSDLIYKAKISLNDVCIFSKN